MEELLLLGLGAVAVALSPFVPAVRPAAKVGVKGGLVIRDAAVAAAGIAASQVGRIRSPWSSHGGAASDAEVAVVTVDVAPAPANAPAKAARKPAATKPAAAKPTAAKPTAEEAISVEAPIPTLVDVNGIGPKVAELLTAAGVTTLEELSEADPEQLRTILSDAGSRYRAMNPDTWPGQARALLEAMPRGDLDGDGIG